MSIQSDPGQETPKKGHPITFADVKANPKVNTYIEAANDLLKTAGFTEHGHRHVGLVADITRYIMGHLHVPRRDIELGQIAAFLHDIGNVISRIDHAVTGASIALYILNEMGMDPKDIAPIVGAIGNHEEQMGAPVSAMCAALIIADKSDVHYTRVQNPDFSTFDIHDRVNHAVQKSRVEMNKEENIIKLNLLIDTSSASVMDYFEIFLSRMIVCRNAAKWLGYKFSLSVNGTYLE